MVDANVRTLEHSHLATIARSQDAPKHRVGYAAPVPPKYRPEGVGARDRWVQAAINNNHSDGTREDTNGKQPQPSPEYRGKFMGALQSTAERRKNRTQLRPLVPAVAFRMRLPLLPPTRDVTVSPRSAREVHAHNALITDELAKELLPLLSPSPKRRA